MAKPVNGATATSPLSLFSPANRERLLKQVVGKPTNVTVELAGVTLELLPLSTAEGLSIIRYVQRFGELARAQTKDGNIPIPELTQVIGSDGRDVLMITMKYIARCAGLRLEYRGRPTSAGDEVELGELRLAEQPERALFEEWFAQLPLVELLKVIVPKVIEANGIGELTRPTAPAPATTAPEATLSS